MEVLNFDLLSQFGQRMGAKWLGHLGVSHTAVKQSFCLLSALQCIEAMQACLVQDLLVVEWQSSTLEVDTWMIEWFPDLDSEPSDISWESVSQARNWTIPQGS